MNFKPTHQQQDPHSEKQSISLAYVVYLVIFLVAICWSAWRLVSFVPERQHLGDDEAAIHQHQHQQPPDEYTSLLNSHYNSTEHRTQGQANPNMANDYNSTGPGTAKPADVRDEHHGTGLIQVRTLDPALLPRDITTTGQQNPKRLVIIGDVHGCRASLEALLEKVAFLSENDHLIFVGDMINKGPDSVGVVEIARKYGASAVRGNHEDRILKIRREMDLDGGSGDDDDDESESDSESSDEGSDVNGVDDAEDDGSDDQNSGDQSDSGKKSKKEKKKDKKEKKGKGDKKDKKDKKAKKKDKKKQSDDDDDKKKNKKGKKDKKEKKKGKKDKKSKGKNKGKGKGTEKEARERALAALLPKDQVQWLESCPVILRLGQIRGMGEVIVVHGGVVPGVDLEKHHPDHVMTMRSIDEKKNIVLDSPEGTMWAKLFNNHQSNIYSSVQKTHADPISKTMTVIYGHDARSGLSIEKHTKGLDSGCVKGNQLTALVIEDGGKQSLVHVKCQDDVEKE